MATGFSDYEIRANDYNDDSRANNKLDKMNLTAEVTIPGNLSDVNGEEGEETPIDSEAERSSEQISKLRIMERFDKFATKLKKKIRKQSDETTMEMISEFKKELFDSEAQEENIAPPLTGADLFAKMVLEYPLFPVWISKIGKALQDLAGDFNSGPDLEAIDFETVDPEMDAVLWALFGVSTKRLEVMKRVLRGSDLSSLYIPESGRLFKTFLKDVDKSNEKSGTLTMSDSRFEDWIFEWKVDSSQKMHLVGAVWTQFVSSNAIKIGDSIKIEKDSVSQKFYISILKYDDNEGAKSKKRKLRKAVT